MMLRPIAAAAIVVVAVLCAPAALAPVWNSADAIVIAAPLALLALYRREIAAWFRAHFIPEDDSTGWSDEDRQSVEYLERVHGDSTNERTER